MLQFYADGGLSLDGGDGGNGGGNAASLGSMSRVGEAMRLTRADILGCKEAAVRRVRVPGHVIQMITDLRTYLQDKCEPPVYVSDRRLVKSIQLLQVMQAQAGLCR
jgi:MoxR-like ATPase